MLVEKKILESERNQVYVKSNEGTRLTGSVTENKDAFDKFPQLIMNKYNELIDLLIAMGLDTIVEDLENRYTKSQTDELVEAETNSLVADIEINLTTGVVTVLKKDGTSTTIDTALEKVPATFEFVEDTENDKFYIKVTNVDGTTSQTEVTNLMNQYTFRDGDIVSFSISKSGTTTTVTANIKNGSIGFAQLNAEVKQYYEDVKSAIAADRAAVEADKAVVIDASQTVTANTSLVLSYKKTAEENATLAKSYAIGNTGTRVGEDTDNAKHYCNQAKTAENAASAIKTDVENAKEEAVNSREAAAQSALNAASSANNASANATYAQQSREAAALSEANASSSKSSAAESASSALESKEAAAESASAAATSETNAATSAAEALAAQLAAEKARDEAREIVGGDYVTETEFATHTDNADLHVTAEEKAAWNAKATKPTITTTTLLASNWTANTYSFEADYPSENYDIEVDINGDDCTDEQFEAWIAIKPLASLTNKINSKGTVPTIDIPVILTVTPK